MSILTHHIFGLFLDTFPKPWLFAEPSSVVPMGQNVTLWCQGPVHGVGYILHKEREATSVQLWGSTSKDGAFLITNISGANIGRYSCCYHPDWTSPIKIQPSNTLELIVTGKRKVLCSRLGSIDRREWIARGFMEIVFGELKERQAIVFPLYRTDSRGGALESASSL